MSGPARASGLTITASYKGSVTKTGGQFTNTTPQSGVCADMPDMCPKGYFSILFPWAGNLSQNIGVVTVSYNPFATYSDESVSMTLNSNNRSVQVYNDHGVAHTVTLFVDAIGFMNDPSSGSGYVPYDRPWGTNCRSLGTRGIGRGIYALWTGQKAGHAFCWIGSTQNQKVRLGYVSFRYRLSLDKPWSWAPGIYRGTYNYGYGPSGDIYFGPNFSGSADDVAMNFVLNVQPDIYVHFPGDHGGVVSADLMPLGGWFNWQGRTPPSLSAEVPFDFASTAPVKISLQCQSPTGDTCGIVDLKGGSPLPVDALLTDNALRDDSGRQAIDSRLTTTARVYAPLNGQRTGIVPARLTFRTQPGVTKQMQAGHQYGGLVTIVFDSDTD